MVLEFDEKGIQINHLVGSCWVDVMQIDKVLIQ